MILAYSMSRWMTQEYLQMILGESVCWRRSKSIFLNISMKKVDMPSSSSMERTVSSSQRLRMQSVCFSMYSSTLNFLRKYTIRIYLFCSFYFYCSFSFAFFAPLGSFCASLDLKRLAQRYVRCCWKRGSKSQQQSMNDSIAVRKECCSTGPRASSFSILMTFLREQGCSTNIWSVLQRTWFMKCAYYSLNSQLLSWCSPSYLRISLATEKLTSSMLTTFLLLLEQGLTQNSVLSQICCSMLLSRVWSPILSGLSITNILALSIMCWISYWQQLRLGSMRSFTIFFRFFITAVMSCMFDRGLAFVTRKAVAAKMFGFILLYVMNILMKFRMVRLKQRAVPSRSLFLKARMNFSLGVLEKVRQWKQPLEKMRWKPQLSPYPG